MLIKKLIALFLFFPLLAFAQEENGQVIQINTRFHSFVGKPSWLLIIRDLEHDLNIPYLFDIRTGTNAWTAFTNSHDYLITVSNLQFSPYTDNPYTVRHISNFCHLESFGHIIHGQSMFITITGNLTPYRETYRCHIMRYNNANFTIVPTSRE